MAIAKSNTTDNMPLQYNLFGKPNSTVAMDNGQRLKKTNPYQTSAPVSPQPNTVVGNGAETQGTIGVKPAPTTSTDPNAIQNVNTEPNTAVPIKEQAVANPVNYVESFQKQQKATENQYVPDTENKGRGVANWFRKVFKKDTPSQPQTEDQRRKQIQNIALVSDVLRHAANLYYTSRGATPQNIQSQVALNEAKWKAEDAQKAAQEKAQQELALKLQKQQADQAYKTGQLGLAQERNEIAKGNYKLAQEKAGRDAEMHQVNMTAKQTGIDKTKHDMDLADQKFEELKRHNKVGEGQAAQRIAQAAQRMANSTNSTPGKSVGRKGDGSRPVAVRTGTARGTKYLISKDFQDNIETIYDDFVNKGIIPKLMKTDRTGAKYQARPKKEDMITAVVASMGDDSKAWIAHANFVYWGKKFGYKYVEGMTAKAKSNALKEKISNRSIING